MGARNTPEQRRKYLEAIQPLIALKADIYAGFSSYQMSSAGIMRPVITPERQAALDAADEMIDYLAKRYLGG